MGNSIHAFQQDNLCNAAESTGRRVTSRQLRHVQNVTGALSHRGDGTEHCLFLEST